MNLHRQLFPSKLAWFFRLFACAVLSGAAAEVPPWRIEGLQERVRLAKAEFPTAFCELVLEKDLQGIDGFAVVAENQQGFRRLALRRSGNVLRFEAPTKSESLYLYFNGDAPALPEFDERENLFSGALAAAGKWRSASGGKVSGNEGGVRLDGAGTFSFEKEIDGETKGEPIHLEWSFRPESPLPFLLSLNLRQLDAAGNPLPSAAIDPRWLTMAVVPGKPITMRQSGALDPRARKLVAEFSMKNFLNAASVDGLPLPKGTSVAPSLWISKLELRCATRLPICGRNPELFAAGAAGESLKLDGNGGFFFNALPPCFWSEGRQTANPGEFHWPTAEGSVEFFLYPEWKRRRETTLFEAWQKNRKSIFRLSYDPVRGNLILQQKDFAEKAWNKTIPAELKTGQWHHIAVCWDNQERLIFLNGKVLSRENLAGFQYADLASAKKIDRILPNEICLGMPAGIMYQPLRPNYEVRFNPAKGRFDHLRISRTVRYRTPFTPAAAGSVDGATCALFRFDRSLEGVHGDGDGRVRGGLFSPRPLLPETWQAEQRSGGVRTIRRVPAELAAGNDPKKILNRNNFQDNPVEEDFAAARIPVRETFRLKPGGERKITCPEGTVMDFVELRCPPNGSTLRHPVLLREGEPDSRSYAGIVRSREWKNLSERERCDRLFQYAIARTDYFIYFPAEFLPHSRNQLRPNYQPLSLLNSYGADQCGPLNNLLLNLFVQSGNLPANAIAGNEHAFEQVFYDGAWHVYDLSAQTFFPSRNKVDAASQEELENDPWLIAANGSSIPSHFYRRGLRGAGWVPSTPRTKFAIVLRPGESFRIHPYNDGDFNDLQTEWGGATLVAMGREVTEKLNTNRKTWKADRIPPEFSTGFLTAEWKQGDGNALFSRITPKSFCFQIDTPYPLVAVNVVTEPAAKVEYSIDRGRSWREPEKLLTRGRHGMLIRVHAPLASLRSFRCRSSVQMNTRTLPGMLKPGENLLRFEADSPGTAEISIQYRKPAAPIRLEGSIDFGARRGWEKRFLLLNSDKALEIPVKGVGPAAVVKCRAGVQGTLRNGVLSLRATPGEKPVLSSFSICDGEREQLMTVLVCRGARLLTPDQALFQPEAYTLENGLLKSLKARKSGVDFRFKLPEVLNGKFAVLTLARPGTPGARGGGPLFQLRKPDGKSDTLIRKSNLSSEYIKADIGHIFRWAYPQKGRYAYFYPDLLDFSGTDELTIRAADPGAEFAALLLIPAENREEIFPILRYFICLNNLPERFPEREGSLP